MTPDRVALATELRAVVADLRAHLDAARSVGVLAEPSDAPRPEADAIPRVETPEAAPSQAPATDAPARVAAAAAWRSAAERARQDAEVRGGSATSPVPVAQDPPGAEGLAAIAADLAGCTRCTLCAKRKTIVVGTGDPEADLMVIGEGPGEQEDARGEPFVGPAGKMLDDMLTNVLGLTRAQVYIANVVKCRPPDNRDPEPAEIAACMPFLHRQILAVRPKLLLVLGRVAGANLLGLQSITRERGQERSWSSIPAIPTFHPAYLLRVPADKVRTFEDLKAARRRYDALGGRR